MARSGPSSTRTARWRSARSATRPGSPPRIADPTPRAIAAAVRPITETLVAATPLIFTGLAVAVSFRSGAFNIGVEGQFVLGAFGAATAAIALKDQPMFLIILVSTLCGVLTGAFWGFIPGFLKARTGASEVITTIMLNYVAAQIVLFGLRSEFLRQTGLGPADLEGPLGLRAHPADPRPAGDPPPLGLRRRAGHGRDRVLVPVQDDQGLRAPRRGLQHDRRPLRGHERVGLDHPRDVDLGRPGRPRRVDGGPGHRAPDVQRHQLRLRLQRHRPRAARRQPARRDRDRRAAVRRAADRRRADAGQDRHPARPPVLHPGAGDHVRRRPRPHPGDLAGRPAQEVDGRADTPTTPTTPAKPDAPTPEGSAA